MFKKQINTIADVVAWRMCIGCGACASTCPNNAVSLRDIESQGIRAFHDGSSCKTCRQCIDVCPGYTYQPHKASLEGSPISQLLPHWGPVVEIWEGHASDSHVHHVGSSGGVATALSLYLLENSNCEGILHTAPKSGEPWKNTTVVSTTREQVLQATGSRYAPASPCDGFSRLKNVKKGIVFVGKGCDVSALRNAQRVRSDLVDTIDCAIGIFCAGTPSTRGTLELLKKFNVDLPKIQELRYRGRGWPGYFGVRVSGNENFQQLMSYADSWGLLNSFRPLRCYLCPDGTAETADISCGDAWYRVSSSTGSDGISLVLARTGKGRQVVRDAIAKGYVTLSPVDPDALIRSQENLKEKRSSIAGRLFVLKMFGIPVPRFFGWPLGKNWLEIDTKEKIRSLVSTLKRILMRKLYQPQKINSLNGNSISWER
jgi:coenzyme F420 hydrogenase subunit beta